MTSTTPPTMPPTASMVVRRVLYATDLSPASLPAWEEAQLLAVLFGAEITLLHVVPHVPVPPQAYLPPTLAQDLAEAGLREGHQRLDELSAGARERSLKATVRVEGGAAARRILEVAREEQVDVIAMGTHGHTGLGRVLLGSVADRVVRLAPCPVLTVPARTEDGLARPPRLARICYATDFSPSARAAWPWVLALAHAAGADIDLLHVTPMAVPDPQLPAEALGRMAQLLHEQGQAEAEAFLGGCPLPPERVRVVIGRGVVADEILHWSRSLASDLIVMGTHGWSGLVRWMLGSVAHHVIQTAPRPVLTVGPVSPPTSAPTSPPTSPKEERPHVG